MTESELGKLMRLRLSFSDCILKFMLAAAMLGILAAISLPMFAGLLRKSDEGFTKGQVLMIRGGLATYIGDAKSYPATLDALIAGKRYLAAIPAAKVTPYHAASSAVVYGGIPNDAGGWLYDNIVGDAGFGRVWVNCTHTDTRGSAWTSY